MWLVLVQVAMPPGCKCAASFKRPLLWSSCCSCCDCEAKDYLMIYTKQAGLILWGYAQSSCDKICSCDEIGDRNHWTCAALCLRHLQTSETQVNANSCPGTPGSRSRTPSVAFSRPPSWESLDASILEDFATWIDLEVGGKQYSLGSSLGSFANGGRGGRA